MGAFSGGSDGVGGSIELATEMKPGSTPCDAAGGTGGGSSGGGGGGGIGGGGGGLGALLAGGIGGAIGYLVGQNDNDDPASPGI